MAEKEKPKVYEGEEIEERLRADGLEGWYHEDGWIRRKYNTDGWPMTLMAVNAVGYLCEAAWHHADLSVTWGKLWVKLRTHSAGGITDNDFALAREIEDTILWRPDEDSPLEGSPNKFVFSKDSDRRPRRHGPGIRMTGTAEASGKHLFVTGRLAAPALREALGRIELPDGYEVAVMKITVAALMTTSWIGRFLRVPDDVSRIMIPGLCEGDPGELTERFGVEAVRGPADLKALPAHFGQADARARLGERDIRVFAEINDVQKLDRERIVAAAESYREQGADVVDLGVGLDGKWLDDGPGTIAALRERDLSLSIDTLDPETIRMADRAGVDHVLSLNSSNLELAAEIDATPILIPDTPEDLASLDRAIEHLQGLDKPFLVDPIIEPIGSGFAASLARYVEVRRRHPGVEMLMGIGNMTELTEADTTGVTALLIGFCQELGIRNVLTTSVIDWAAGAVREAVIAAELMHYAVEQGTVPKHVDGRLLTVRDEELRPYSEAELRELHAGITDPNFRIFADREWIYAFNAERFVKGTDPNEIFDALGVTEATHAFYLGRELNKAAIARALGKNYRQEAPLEWGYLTYAEPRRERVRTTAHRRSAGGPAKEEK